MLRLEEVLVRAAVAEKDRERLTVAHRNALRLPRLVNALLYFSRIAVGRPHANYEPTSLAALTAKLASNFCSICERAGLRLVVNSPRLTELAHLDHEMREKELVGCRSVEHQSVSLRRALCCALGTR
jgi:signal transduction histidine kinase